MSYKSQMLLWLKQAKNHCSKPDKFLSLEKNENFRRGLRRYVMYIQFFICIWLLCTTTKYIAILLCKMIKVYIHFWYFWSQKCFMGPKFEFWTKFFGLCITPFPKRYEYFNNDSWIGQYSSGQYFSIASIILVCSKYFYEDYMKLRCK